MTTTMRSIGDPHTRVRFNEGMLLRAADLEQESLFLRSRDELATRALHGMGRLLGLNVEWDSHCRQLKVTSGLVVDGNGKILCVPDDRCATAADLKRALDDAHGDEPSPEKQDSWDESSKEAPRASGRPFHVVVCHRDRPAGHDTYISDPSEAGSTGLTATRVVEEARIEIRPGWPDENCCQSIFPPQIREEARDLVCRVLAGRCDEEALCDFLRHTGGCFCEVCDGCVLLACGVAHDVDCDSVTVDITHRPCSLLLPTAVLQEWLFGLEQELDRGPRVIAAGVCNLDDVDMYTDPHVTGWRIRTIGLGDEFADIRSYLHDDCCIPRSRIEQMCDPSDHRLDAVIIEIDEFARCCEDRIVVADAMVIEGIDFALDGNATITRVMDLQASPPRDYRRGVVFVIRQPARDTPPSIQFEITSYPRERS